MAKLEAVLEQRGVASPREVSEAAALSLLHGGDVTTSLLQVANIDEAALSAALSACHGLPAARLGPLPAPEADAPSLPREVAERYCCFPLHAAGDELVLAVSRPLAPGVLEELGFALGLRLTEQVALEVRIRQAIAQHYGVPLAERDRQAIARLEGALEAKSEEQSLASWDDAQLSALPRPPSEPPPSLPPAEHAEWGAEDGSAPARPPHAARPPAAQARWGRRRGPFTIAMAREELARAGTRDQVLEAFFSFACQFFEYTALFAVHRSLAEGLSAWGPGADHEAIQAVGVPLDLPSSLSEAAESCKLRITRLGHDGIDRTLAADLRRQLASRVLILPVCLRARCALLLYGDNGASDVLEHEVLDVAALAPDVAVALGRIILQRKRSAAAQPSLDPGELTQSLPPPRKEARRKASASSFSHPEPSAELAEGAEPEQAFTLPELPSKSRDRSRSNGRKTSVPPPSIELTAPSVPAQRNLGGEPEQPGATLEAEIAPGDPLAAAALAAHAATEGATEPAPPRLSEPPEDPTFLLSKSAGGAPAPAEPPRPPLQRGITHPRPVLQQRRLPSVIVDETSTEQTVWTRAGAVTQPPLSAREAALVRSAALDEDAPTVRPSGKRPAPAGRVDIVPAPAQRAVEPPPPRVVARQGSERKPAAMAPAPPVTAPFPVALTPATPPVAPATTIPVARKRPAAERSSPSTAATPPDTAAEPAAAAREKSPAPAAAGPAADAPPIKPLGQRAITGSPRQASVPAPPFHRDPPPPKPATSTTHPGLAPSAAPAARRSSPIARPDSPSVKAVPRTPTVRPPGPSGVAPAANVQRGAAGPGGENGQRTAARAPTLATADVFSPPPAPEPAEAAPPAREPAEAAPGPAAPASSSGSAGIAAMIADSLDTREKEPTARMPEAEARVLAAASAEPLDGKLGEPGAARGSAPAISPDAVTSAPPAVSAAPAPASQRSPLSSRRPRPALAPPAPADPELDVLIDQLCQGNPRAAQDVTRLGAATVPQLMARFPGPVVSERAGPSSRASECGPLLQALANIGSPAVPEILRSTEDQDARVRRWATLLLGEIPGPEACRAVIQRLADDVPRVHQAALDAARLLLSSSAANLFRKTLFEVAEAEDAPLALRLRTLEHVARLRDSASVPRLISFLSLDTEPVVHKALWVLTVVTRQDFGRDVSAWHDWWQSHQGKHRFQWLIEALDHPDVRIRKAAADELQVEAKDSFGYSEHLPEPERRAAQQRYQDWWDTTGARRFGRLQ